MYITRIIDEKLKSWAGRPNHLPLIMRGARQVGKTAAVMALGRTSGLFDNVVKIDFEEEPGLARVFAGSLKAEHIVRDLEAVTGQPIKAGKTLLFFDEVQECPRAISSLRYFREQMPDLHVVAAGSLLEFVLGEVSMPVGRVDYIYVRPMSFGEFLHATGRGILDSRRPHIMPWADDACPSPIEAEALDSALKEYVIVGGMPEAVSTYVTTKSLIETSSVHDRLLRSFRDDIPKYAQGDLQRANLTQSLLALAASVGQQITYTKLVEDDAKRTKLSVHLLEQAMIVTIARATSAGGLPLGAGVNNKYLKPIYLDVGLMQRACGRSPGRVLDSKNLLADFKGQIAEQTIGQELLVQRGGSENEHLYFWQRAERGSTAEVDFLLSREGHIVPLEVKSGPSGRLRSLHLFLNSHPNIAIGYCLQQRGSLEQVGAIRFAPLWSRLE
jgi:predicted AAA+ superfamily ATPase